jgi:hypothetical protein
MKECAHKIGRKTYSIHIGFLHKKSYLKTSFMKYPHINNISSNNNFNI